LCVFFLGKYLFIRSKHSIFAANFNLVAMYPIVINSFALLLLRSNVNEVKNAISLNESKKTLRGGGKSLISRHLSIQQASFPLVASVLYFIIAVSRFLSRCGFFYALRLTVIPCKTVATLPPNRGGLATGVATLPPNCGRLATGVATLPPNCGGLAKGVATLPPNRGGLAKGVATLSPDCGLATLVSTGYFSYVKLSYNINV
jgi:hypothetical protein